MLDAVQVGVTAFVVIGGMRRPGLGVLDPITVIARNHAPSKGQVILECWGRAWSAYWGNTGEADLRAFFVGADPDYLANCLLREHVQALVTNKRIEQRDRSYLTDIVKAVQAAWPADLRPQYPRPAP